MRPEAGRGAWGLVVLAALAGCKHLPFASHQPSFKPADGADSDYKVKDSKDVARAHAEQVAVGMAFQHLQSGDPDGAEKSARKALALNPQSTGAWTVLGLVAQQRGHAAEAGEDYRHAAELAPNDGGALNNYGAWLCANGYPAEALVWFDRALAAPGYATPAAALANAGGCALQTGQYERVEPDLRKALELDPANAYALQSMARNEYRLGRYLGARAFIERRLAAAPADAGVLQLAADIETKLGDRTAASRYEQRLREEFPGATATNSGNGSTP
ncbi:MAG: type IV pilus biogenesis/stability protein PilW [Pseudoxanthomonas sp.]